MTKQLKPCPLCGSEEIIRGFYDEVNDNYIYCKKCYFGIDNYYAKDHIDKRWNTRPIEDKLLAEIETLRGKVERLTEQLEIIKHLRIEECRENICNINLCCEIAKNALSELEGKENE